MYQSALLLGSATLIILLYSSRWCLALLWLAIYTHQLNVEFSCCWGNWALGRISPACYFWNNISMRLGKRKKRSWNFLKLSKTGLRTEFHAQILHLLLFTVSSIYSAIVNWAKKWNVGYDILDAHKHYSWLHTKQAATCWVSENCGIQSKNGFSPEMTLRCLHL